MARKKAQNGKDGNGSVPWLTVVGARQNNLRNITVEIPLGRFVCVTGVSGSGKSSLVNDIIREVLARDLNGAEKVHPGLHDRVVGLEHLDKVIDIDQSPIGRTPRSNPATYIKVFDEIRALFARLPDAKVRGYKPGRFSFNVPTGRGGGGRCEACQGNGSHKMELELLADVWVTCQACRGRRFSRETLEILYKRKSIADVLDMDVQEALEHFETIPKIARMLRTLHDVGLDYMKLGQSSTTLSGGEAQRIKLSRELVKTSTGRTLYLLDEPTTGLHFADIKKLLAVLHGFVDAGNTVIVIEHNLDVIKTADWVIDLGPEGGEGGGRIVAAGTPEHIGRTKRSHTGRVLQDVLNVETSQRPILKTSKRPDGKVRAKMRAGSNGRRKDVITVVGAKQHNLKDITVDVPRGKMTVCCGPSGSGKSSFAIDTVYAEGQRRYVESLSAYARQFLGRLQPPKVDHVYGLSPAISIEQKNTSKSPRSTVGTVTEIYDFMRVLWARVGQPYCPTCKVPVGAQSGDEIVERILALGDRRRVLLLAPVEPGGQETYEQLFQRERAGGYVRVRVDGVIHSLGERIPIDHKRKHQVELVVDRIVTRRRDISRITDSVEQALTVGRGVMIAQPIEENVKTSKRQDVKTAKRRDRPTAESRAIGEYRFSLHRSCEQCGRGFDELTPHHFSFNTRMGWCEACEGLGVQQGASPAAIVVHPTRSIVDGAIAGWGVLKPGNLLYALAFALADAIGFDVDTAWNELTDAQRLALLQGHGDEWIQVDTSCVSGASDKPTKQGVKSVRGGAPSNPMPGLRFKWRGFFPAINRATRSSWQYRKRLENLVTEVSCEACSGSRLKPEPACARLGSATIHEVGMKPLSQALAWFERLKLDPQQRRIAGELLQEITSRLRFLVEVGLNYLSLHRMAGTLSGGEAQRIQLASQIGSGLTGVLYVLDEPTIGLHPRDNHRLLQALARLRDLGNTLLVVEHDREVIDSSDHVLDFGPGAGALGGTITAACSPKRIRSKRASLTGRYLSFKETIPIPSNRRPVPRMTDHRIAQDEPLSRGFQPARTFEWGTDEDESGRFEQDEIDDSGRIAQAEIDDSETFAQAEACGSGRGIQWLIVHGAREHNLKEIDAAFPLGRFTCVTGVSGSGKSTLVSTILYNALAARIHRARVVPGGHDRITGIDPIDKVINVDASPIGNSPTSNPATYTGVFDAVRELFTKLPMSKIRGYTANRFSFNRPGGRCEACQGMGQRCIEMHFLPDVWVECEPCRGKRYVPETLEVRYRGKNIADVLEMNVRESLELFQPIPQVRRMLQTLDDVGLGYVQLGQPAPTLSGGEAQRVKLAAELGRPSTGKTLYILDEPTTGLHFDDLKKLLNVLHRLVDSGNTVICIEHNLDVIKTADWVIDLGPEAGQAGGWIVVADTPERVACTKDSHTGVALAPVLAAGPVEERPVYGPGSDDGSWRSEWEEGVRAARGESTNLDESIGLPWERDGRTWHTLNHVDRKGTHIEWNAAVLVWIVETIESLGEFARTDWNHRTRIEIKAPGQHPWFCHILTGGKDLLEVALRVSRGTFRQADLVNRLGVKTLDERSDLAIYGQWSRVRLRSCSAGWEEVRLYLRDFKDVAKGRFRAFLKTAVGGYFGELERTEAQPDRAQPWKSDGRQWHLSQKSIQGRHVIRWKQDLLLAMVGRFKAMDPQLEVSWDSKTAVRFFLSNGKRLVGKIVTNMGRGLRVELRAPSGVLTPTQVERLGEDVEIAVRDGHDRVSFWVRALNQNDARQMHDIWRKCRLRLVDEGLQSA